jgi:galactokinase
MSTKWGFVTCFDPLTLLQTASTSASLLDYFLRLWSKNGPATGLHTTGTGMGGSIIQLVVVMEVRSSLGVISRSATIQMVRVVSYTVQFGPHE